MGMDYQKMYKRSIVDALQFPSIIHDQRNASFYYFYQFVKYIVIPLLYGSESVMINATMRSMGKLER